MKSQDECLRRDVLMRQDVVALTVTYGRRIALLRLCVDALEAAGIVRLVVVTNGIGADYRRELETLRQEVRVAIDLVHLERNVGAGGGFAAAINYARATYGEKFLWLLDDDNCPRENAIRALELAMNDSDPVGTLIAFSGLRGERFPLWLMAAKTGAGGDGVFYEKSSISSLDVRRIRTWIGMRLTGNRKPLPTMAEVDTSVMARHVDIPGAPYGGFFIHSRNIDTIGLPDERYVLYFDDLEWTNRVCRQGGRIVLVPGCVIDDAEGDWAIEPSEPRAGRFFMVDLIRSEDRKRLYYSVRNNIYFKSRYWSDGWGIMLANVGLFVALSVGLGLRFGRVRNALTMIQGAFDGVLGRMGGSL
ncbi:glycosyltransferase [Bradyrhizobium sp. SSUT112]|uniref:glycosyltransferase n=1 Tax=Bradyrhizobium sp. SSUT112 TaxID=3040604 RepID=UPI002446FC5F|nr:glycosyltransferase [Bradyrhizobium sp. SSUT112]MDH2356821.1 glycosyltransferase [Bradyrhizobium sp. SSUT112]